MELLIDKKIIRQVHHLALESARQGFDLFAALLVRDGVVVASSMDKRIMNRK